MLTDQARENMIEQQIRPWNVIDEDVLNVMKQIPREFFVPAEYKELAFADTEIPLPEGQSMMEPKIEARMLQALAIKPGDKVLEVGTGSGYVTACLDWLSDEVTSVEIFESLSTQAQEHLAAFGILDAKLIVDDVFTHEFNSLFDVIAVTGSLPTPTDRFEKLLANGGRLFQVVGQGASARAQLVTRVADEIFHREELFETALPALINAPEPESFVF
jgi:protein-L-isoaspartate(D-aspartate) O-methyltransferase